MSRRMRIVNIILTTLIFGGFIALAIFVYKDSYARVWESIQDLWNSLKFFVKEVFMLDFEAEPTVTEFSKVLHWQKILPEDFENFKLKFGAYFSLFATKENFNLYMSNVGTTLANFSKSLVIIIPVGLILWLIIKAMYSKSNTKHNHDTLPLKMYKKLMGISYHPIRNFISQYIRFYRSNQNSFYFSTLVKQSFILIIRKKEAKRTLTSS